MADPPPIDPLEHIRQPFPFSIFQQHTPVKASSIHGSNHFSAISNLRAPARQEGERQAMDGKLSLIDPEDMLSLYVPAPEGWSEPSDKKLASAFKFNGKVKPESKMNDALPKAIKDAWLRDQHEFTILATQSKVDPSDETKQRIDISVFRQESAPTDSDEPTNYCAVELSGECKSEEIDDPFDDDAPDYQATSDNGRANFGQIISYAALVFAKQQRTHHFTVLFLGHKARIIRWDRAGAIVTKKFDYMKEPAILGKFFWRYVRLSDAQRGHDTSVTEVLSSSEDYRLMRQRADTPRVVKVDGVNHAFGEHARRLFQDSLKSTIPWYRIRVGGEEDGRYFLVGAPHFIASGLVGRGTRGYVAIDCSDPQGPFVYLKDAWRVAHPGIEREGSILEYLNERGVMNVPTLICHGDVDDQETESQRQWRKHHPDRVDDCPVKTHHHYRIVVKEVGLPMSHFHTCGELVYLLAGCIRAHEAAYNQGILHRDISAGNVLILVTESVVDGELEQTRDGMLTDWELSKRLDEPNLEPRQPDRTGTWQFMSASALTDPCRVIIIADEIESFFHLLLFFTIRFIFSNCSDVSRFMYDYFDGYQKIDNVYTCGTNKFSAMSNGKLVINKLKLFFLKSVEPTDVVPVPSGAPEVPPSGDGGVLYGPRNTHPINIVFKDLLSFFSAHYTLEEKAVHDSPKPSASRSGPGISDKPIPKKYNWFKDDYAVEVSTVPTLDATNEMSSITPEEEARLKARAKNVRTHRAAISYLGSRLLQSDWPDDDKVPDRHRKDFQPDRDPKPAPPPSTRGSKRRSQHQEADFDELAPPLKRRSARGILQPPVQE